MKKIILRSAIAISLCTAANVWAGGDIAAGKAASATCTSCHGAEGVSAAALYPHIGGQYESYLLRSLRRYKSGERQNAIMQGMVAGLSDDDMENLAAYYASLTGVLKDGTVKP